MSAIVTIDSGRCKGCGLCIAACPLKIVEVDTEIINASGYHPATVKQTEKCSGCTSCAIICPDIAIRIERGGSM